MDVFFILYFGGTEVNESFTYTTGTLLGLFWRVSHCILVTTTGPDDGNQIPELKVREVLLSSLGVAIDALIASDISSGANTH